MSSNKEYLNHIRQRNIKIASICFYCKNPSTGIISDGYAIHFVCDDHQLQEDSIE